ncbi:hypothetical protein HRW18_05440 [Streptomyces lunaelactis]|uniref:hypothetical protein n=1 Tax=Streptomyces lunaelactis TaxID=1535768 RepID=UPI0015847F5F|nr:hypothetical protein [Streptomyces lunaelactis]NUK07466.1 hypothetical protein [Streptomyces lunaelactis]
MARIYATAADYETYTGHTPPAGIDASLAHASEHLDAEVFRLCWFEADGDDYPSNTIVREAFRRATCAQVQWWDEIGDELGTGGRWNSVKLGSAALSRSSGSSSGSGGSSQDPVVAERALRALRNPDLICDIFVLGMVFS